MQLETKIAHCLESQWCLHLGRLMKCLSPSGSTGSFCPMTLVQPNCSWVYPDPLLETPTGLSTTSGTSKNQSTLTEYTFLHLWRQTWQRRFEILICVFSFVFSPFLSTVQAGVGSVLPCLRGSSWQKTDNSPFPLLGFVPQKPKLVGEILLTASGKERRQGCF